MALWLLLAAMGLLPKSTLASAPYGMANKPFPAIMSLDYAPGRAAAWLNALKNATGLLPSSIDARLRSLEFDVSVARLGICASMFAIEIVTPEISPARQIRVYLAEPANISQSIEELLADPALLGLATVLVCETMAVLEKTRQAWPQSIARAMGRITELEDYTKALEGLWQACALLKPRGDIPWNRQLKKLHAIAELAPQSALVQFLIARAALKAGLPQAAIAAANKSLAMEINSGDPRYAGILRVFSANIHYERALAHWRLDQPALASSDLATAARLMRECGIKCDFLAGIYLKLGEIARMRRDMDAMCAALQEACGQGQCQNYAIARRQGLCGGMPAEARKD